MCRTSFHVCYYGSPHQGGPYQSLTGSCLLLYHLFHSLFCTIDIPMYTAGESVFYRRSDGSLVPATVLGPGAQSETDSSSDSGSEVGDVFDSDDSSDSDGAGDGASANDQCVDIIWAKAARGVWGLAHVFNNKLFFTRDIMDDDAVPKHFNVPDPKPKPKPKPAPKASVAPKPGPKGQHRQEFRMVYHRKKGFTSQPVEQ